MRPAFESVGTSSDASFLVKRFREPVFSAPYHFHPEYELTLIEQGKGLRYVGSHSAEYSPGDLVLLGPDLPHVWKTTTGENAEESVSIVVQFGYACLGEAFFGSPELEGVSRLFELSRCGIHFKGEIGPLQQQMRVLATKENGLPKLLAFLDILDVLAGWQDFELLDKRDEKKGPIDGARDRLREVMTYIVNHFRGDITLTRAAAIANLSEYSFCRWFRRTHRRSFMQVVIDYRVDYAIHQLVHTDEPIARIAYDCGFNELSNFHKAFKSRRGISPLSYRRRFHSGLATPAI